MTITHGPSAQRARRDAKDEGGAMIMGGGLAVWAILIVISVLDALLIWSVVS